MNSRWFSCVLKVFGLQTSRVYTPLPQASVNLSRNTVSVALQVRQEKLPRVMFSA